MLLIAFSFLAGIVTIASPCIFPLLPIILTGSVGSGRFRPWGIVVGFVVVFSAATLTFAILVQAIGLPIGSLRWAAIMTLILFGSVMLVPRLQFAFEALAGRVAGIGQKMRGGVKANGFGAGLVLGSTLGLVWTPCVGPIMASVITVAAAGSISGSTVAVTIAYAAGTAIPMFLIIVGGKRVIARFGVIKRSGATIQRVFAVLMIVTGVGIAFNLDRMFQAYMLDAFPALERSITFFEYSPVVDREIDRLIVE